MSFVLVQVIVGGLLLGAVYALFSSGLTLVWGMMNIVNFAHGDFVMLGMYVAYVVYTLMGGGPILGAPLATLVLASTLALFVLAKWLLPVHPVFGFVAAFAEAATIGGLADWYAVVALFKRPLGLPIPHTAIIQSNQARIAAPMPLPACGSKLRDCSRASSRCW